MRAGRVRQLAGSWPRVAAGPRIYARWSHAGWHPPALLFTRCPTPFGLAIGSSRRDGPLVVAIGRSTRSALRHRLVLSTRPFRAAAISGAEVDNRDTAAIG